MRAGLVHVEVVGEGVEVETAIEFAQLGDLGVGVHALLSYHRHASRAIPQSSSGSTWNGSGGSFRG